MPETPGPEPFDFKALINSKIVKWAVVLLGFTGGGKGAVEIARYYICQVDINAGAIDFHHHPGVRFTDQSACYYKGRETARLNSEED